MADIYTKLGVKNILEKVTNTKDITNVLNDRNNIKLHKNSITHFKRVGRKGNTPRNIILSMDSYESKLL